MGVASGAISLNDIHTWVGGTTETEVTLNDSDIRQLKSFDSEDEMDFSDFYAKFSATMYVNSIYGGWGFLTASGGSMTSTDLNIFGVGFTDLQIYGIYHQFGARIMKVDDDGSAPGSAATAWTTLEVRITVAGSPTSFNRTDASYSVSGGKGAWSWGYGSSPFGTTGGASRYITII